MAKNNPKYSVQPVSKGTEAWDEFENHFGLCSFSKPGNGRPVPEMYPSEPENVETYPSEPVPCKFRDKPKAVRSPKNSRF